MNEVMYVLTMVTTIFVPAQFPSGVYGMNFRHIPELEFKYGYLVFWIAVVFTMSSALIYFKSKRWV